jgi:hypothetical protein
MYVLFVPIAAALAFGIWVGVGVHPWLFYPDPTS